jgi:hypothetical protein
VRVDRWLADQPYPRAEVEELPVIGGHDHQPALATAEVAVRRLRSLASELGEVPALVHDLEIVGTDEEIAWQLCELAPLNLMDRQALLASLTLEEQLDRLARLCEAMAADVVAMLAGGFEG